MNKVILPGTIFLLCCVVGSPSSFGWDTNTWDAVFDWYADPARCNLYVPSTDPDPQKVDMFGFHPDIEDIHPTPRPGSVYAWDNYYVRESIRRTYRDPVTQEVTGRPTSFMIDQYNWGNEVDWGMDKASGAQGVANTLGWMSNENIPLDYVHIAIEWYCDENWEGCRVIIFGSSEESVGNMRAY